MVIYRSPVDIPEGLEPTKAYEIISGEDDLDKLEDALFRAVSEGWRTEDIREMKVLRREGLLDQWQRLRLTLEDDGSLSLFTSEGDARCFGEVNIDSQDRLVMAAVALLKRRAIS